MTLERIAVVGASLAGIRTVQALRSAGYDGALTLVGDEHSPPYDRPPLSKGFLAGTTDVERLALVSDDRLTGLEIDLRLGTRAIALDPAAKTITLSDGGIATFDAAVLATGARPRTLGPKWQRENVHVLRTIADAEAIRNAVDGGATRVVVVGAGFIGAEVAATLRRRGCSVTLVEPLPVPLGRVLRPELGAVVEAMHRDEGVDVRCGTAVAGVAGEATVVRVVLEPHDVIDADLVVAGIGVQPNTEWLETSGLELGDGLVCDQTLRAAGGAPVWGAGDVARWHNPLLGSSVRIEHWTNASEHGAAVARNILAGAAATPVANVPYVWSDQYGIKIQILGRPEHDDHLEIVHGTVEERKFVALCGRGGRLSSVVGFRSPKLVMSYQSLLAAGASFDDALAVARDVTG